MKIQFRKWYDRKGDVEDPKTGSPMAASSETVYRILSGKKVSAIGGIFEGTESFSIQFEDGTDIWFVTAGGPPRVLFSKYPAP